MFNTFELSKCLIKKLFYIKSSIKSVAFILVSIIVSINELSIRSTESGSSTLCKFLDKNVEDSGSKITLTKAQSP